MDVLASMMFHVMLSAVNDDTETLFHPLARDALQYAYRRVRNGNAGRVVHL